MFAYMDGARALTVHTSSVRTYLFVILAVSLCSTLGPSELYQKSLCKYRNELALYLTIMVVSIGFMSSSIG